ncbi:MAG: stage III sporulation protein AD [Acutalibacteraceae bacterium]
MNILSVCVCAIAAAVLAVAIKRHNPEISMLLTAGGGIIIFIAILSAISPVINKINALAQTAGMSQEYVEILIKSLGICFLCQFSSDACKDAGQTALASKVELAGKLFIVILALPMLEDITNTALRLVGGG